MRTLDLLNQIPNYGRRNFNGNTYSIKWKYTVENAELLCRILNANVPYLKNSLLVHTTRTNEQVIIGGTFDKNSGVFEAWKRFQTVKKA